MTLVDTSSWIPFLRRGGDVSVKKRVRKHFAKLATYRVLVTK